jgi:hypothetical protein
MSGRQRAQEVLTEFARSIELEELTLDGNDSCRLSFDGEILVDIDFDSVRERLVLGAQLGHPNAGAEADICRAALRFNALWQTTDAVIGCEGADGGFVLLRQLPAAELDRAGFEVALASVLEAARGWHRLIQEAVPSQAAASPALHHGFSIRV